MIIKKKNKEFSYTSFEKIYILFFFSIFLKLVENIKYNINPYVSIFLPIFNKQFYLERSIGSIQSQTLKNLEIIAVNDCSNDSSLKILKNLAKKDNRIKIVNNDRNHGLLYSRAMGILNCTGEYVLNLDPDDMFSNIHNLKILYKIAKKNDTDLIIFELKLINIYRIENSKFNKIIKDFKLNKINSNNKLINKNFLITNKFIKKEIILKVYESFKNKIYGSKWNYHEDNIWSKMITNYSKSRILLNKYILLSR